MNKMMLKKQYMMYSPKKKGRLPSEYQEVEYIQGTGTQYINSLVIPTSKTGWEIEFEQTKIQSVWYFGVDTGWLTNGFGFNVYKPQNETNIYPLLYINSSASNKDFEKIEANQRYVVRYGNGLLRVNSTEYSVPSFTGNLTNPIYTNSINRNGTPDSIAQGTGKIYSLKFYEDNTIIRDFVPCYRKSDNEVGLYDIVGKQFYTNSGSGTFNYGRPLVYDTIQGYQQVDYIELKREHGTYGSYLDIDDYIVNTSQYKTEIRFIEPSDATQYNCFGFANNGNSIVSQLGVFSSSGTRYIVFQHKTKDTVDNIPFDTNWHTYYCENGGQYFDGVKKFSNSISYTTETNINKWYLFSRAVNGEVWNNGYCYIQCKYFFTYRNNKLKRILIPMRRLVDGEIGMYDLNKGVFYTDEYGTHSFTSGEVLTA